MGTFTYGTRWTDTLSRSLAGTIHGAIPCPGVLPTHGSSPRAATTARSRYGPTTRACAYIQQQRQRHPTVGRTVGVQTSQGNSHVIAVVVVVIGVPGRICPLFLGNCHSVGWKGPETSAAKKQRDRISMDGACDWRRGNSCAGYWQPGI